MKKKMLTIQEYELPVTIQAEKEGGFVATCPIWKDCYAQGETIEETINELSYVASALIELYKEENIGIPLKIKSATKKEAKGFSIIFPLIISTN